MNKVFSMLSKYYKKNKEKLPFKNNEFYKCSFHFKYTDIGARNEFLHFTNVVVTPCKPDSEK